MTSNENSAQDRQREQWVDTLRVVLIAGVIVVHTATVRSPLRRRLDRVHAVVPGVAAPPLADPRSAHDQGRTGLVRDVPAAPGRARVGDVGIPGGAAGRRAQFVLVSVVGVPVCFVVGYAVTRLPGVGRVVVATAMPDINGASYQRDPTVQLA